MIAASTRSYHALSRHVGQTRSHYPGRLLLIKLGDNRDRNLRNISHHHSRPTSSAAAAVPGVCVQLFDAVQAGDHQTAHDLHRRLARLWNAMTHDNLPACVKCAQHRQGLGFYPPRAPMPGVSTVQKEMIDSALRGLPLG